MSDVISSIPSVWSERVDAYVNYVRARAFDTSGDAARAEIAAREAQAQAVGDHGVHGVATFRRWLVATKRIGERHIVAQASLPLANGGKRVWSRWTDGSITVARYDRDLSIATVESTTVAPTNLSWVCTTTLRPMAELEALDACSVPPSSKET